MDLIECVDISIFPRYNMKYICNIHLKKAIRYKDIVNK